MQLGYVCTNFNNSSFTSAAVRSLLASGGHNCHVVVVDNNSDEANVAALAKLKEEIPAIHVIFSDENLGYFPGLNIGIRHLRSMTSPVEYMVVGNNDLIFPQSFYTSVVGVLDKFNTFPVISPDVVTLDGEHQNPHVINGISTAREIVYDIYYANYALARLISSIARWTKRFTDRDDERQYQIGQEIDQGHGSCYLLGPVFFKHFDQLWAPTFLMGEEFFLCKQLNDRHLRVYYEPLISVSHHCHAAVSKLPSRKMWEFARDAHRIYREHVKVLGPQARDVG